ARGQRGELAPRVAALEEEQGAVAGLEAGKALGVREELERAGGRRALQRLEHAHAEALLAIRAVRRAPPLDVALHLRHPDARRARQPLAQRGALEDPVRARGQRRRHECGEQQPARAGAHARALPPRRLARASQASVPAAAAAAAGLAGAGAWIAASTAPISPCSSGSVPGPRLFWNTVPQSTTCGPSSAAIGQAETSPIRM